MFTSLTTTDRYADDLTAIDLGRVTAADYSALCDLARRNGAVRAAGRDGDVAHDALFFLASALREAESWTPVHRNAASAVTTWLDESFGAPSLPISRDTLLRSAVDAAAEHYRVGIDAFEEPVGLLRVA
jgi:hypothetical protein